MEHQIMDKLTIDTLQSFRETVRKSIEVRTHPSKDQKEKHILVCGGTGCESNKGDTICQKLKAGIKEKGLEDSVKVVKTGCFGFCAEGPILKVMPERVFYTQVTPEDVDEIVETELVKGEKVERLLYKEQQESHNFEKDINFYDKQERVVLRNCGIINPEDVDEYIANDGYGALSKVLSGMTPELVLAELKEAGLRGRGGGGFPTWLKWENTRKAKGERKFIICNGDEGDPGAYMDRSILEGDPHAVLEAMAIAGFTVGASKGYLYIRAEYGLAIRRVRQAIEQAYKMGLMGKNIMGTGFDFEVDIRLGAGAFVCGEETALIASIEGQRGTPRPRPPFPSIKGLFGMPTVINNVETLANIPVILTRGAKWYSGIGTETSKGTKVFALTGKVNVSGLIEVPMGTTIREIVYDIGGGAPDGETVKAVQTGGPSGGMIPAEFFDTPVDYENLKKLDSMMGSGGLIVIGESDSMVEFAKFYLGFCVDESCGKCSPCRIGGYQMLTILERFSKGKANPDDFQKLENISLAMRKASLCGLGQTAPNPIMSAIKHFRSEFDAKIKKPKVPLAKK